MGWKVYQADGVALADFAPNGPHQIAIAIGDPLRIFEEYDSQWFRGTNDTTKETGIFPVNHVHLRPADEDPVAREVTSVLKEWVALMKQYFIERRAQDYIKLKGMTEILTNFHRKLHTQGVTEHQKNEFRASAVAKIEEGRRLLGMDMVVRTAAGEPANETNTPLVELYKMHRRATVALSTNKSAVPRSNSGPRLRHTGSVGNIASGTDLPPSKQLCVNVKSFVCAVGEDTELKFFLYQPSKNLVISETFLVNLTARGLPVDPKLANNLITVFRDIPPMIPLGDLLLVCRIFRRGALQPKKDGAKPPKPGEKVPDLRRPFGVAIQNIGQAGIKRGKEVEQTMPIYQPKDEALFWNMPQLIFDMVNKDIEVAPRSTGIIVGLNMFTGNFKDTILRDLNYRSMPVTMPLDMNNDDPLTGVRHDMYFTLQTAELQKARAVELYVSVRDAQSKVVDRAILAGAAHSPFPHGITRSFVLDSTATPRWDETFCLKIPTASVLPGLHVLIAFKAVDKSGKDGYFAYAKMDLTSAEGTIIKDGSQTLQVFKEGKGVNTVSEPNWYMKEKPSDSSKAKVVLKKDTIKCSTKLISNQFTQNPYLHSLFNWKTVQPAKLIDALGKMTFAAPEEIIKFIRNIFDSCFMVLDAKVPNAPPHVFTALVYVIGTLVDERTGKASFRVVLDEYLQNHFKSVTTLEHFTTALVQYFGQYESKKSSELINTLKALEYIVKFIIQSAVLFAQMGGDPTPYKHQMLVFFQQVNALLRNNKPQFVGAITIAVKKVAPLFPQLLRLFAPVELASITIEFINSIPYSESQKSLNNEKLALFQDLMSSALFQDAEAGRALLQTVVYHTQMHLQSKSEDEIQNCIEVLLRIVDMLQRVQQTAPDFIGYVTALLPTVMRFVLNPPADAPASAIGDKAGANPPAPAPAPTNPDGSAAPSQKVSDMAMVLLSFFFLMQPQDFTNYFGGLQDYAQQKEFLGSTTELLGRIASRRLATFPENWFVMLMFQYSVSLKVTIILASFMQERLTIIDHEPELWSSFFSLLVDFVGARILELESFTETKRKLVLQSYGDMRMDVLQVLQVMWGALDQWQYHFLKNLMKSFLRLASLEQPTLSQAGADLYVTLVQREITATGALKVTENITIGTLEEMFQSVMERSKEVTKGLEEEEEYVRTFFTNLFASKLAGLGSVVDKFLRDMTAWLERLYELRTIPEDSGFEDDRTDSTLKLMEWLKGINRMDLYKKYAHQLSLSHTAANNFAEAGMAVLLMAKQYPWMGPVTEEALGDMPMQTQGERRVRMYKSAIEYLDKGKMWEKCISLIKEMKEQGVAPPTADQDIARFEQMIASQERFFCEYFRVGYYGRGFPATVRNKEFIYRGFELERLADFTQRINQKFPQAKVLNFTDPPGDEVTQADTQSLQVFSVKPSSKEEKDGKPNPRLEAAQREAGGRPLPQSSQKYWASNEIGVFSYSKPFRKNKRKDEKPHEEFADLWYKNYFYVLSDSLPSVNRRADIVTIETTETHPIDNAINAISEKNREIVAMTTKYEGGQGGAQLGPFTMILKGVIDAAVSGGTVLYQKAFFCDEWLQANPDKVEKAESLNQLLINQLVVLDKGLKVHANLCPPEMALLQQDLDMRMINVKREVKNSLQATQELFQRNGGSGVVKLDGLDLSNIDPAPAPAATPLSPQMGGAGGLAGSGGFPAGTPGIPGMTGSPSTQRLTMGPLSGSGGAPAPGSPRTFGTPPGPGGLGPLGIQTAPGGMRPGGMGVPPPMGNPPPPTGNPMPPGGVMDHRASMSGMPPGGMPGGPLGMNRASMAPLGAPAGMPGGPLGSPPGSFPAPTGSPLGLQTAPAGARPSFTAGPPTRPPSLGGGLPSGPLGGPPSGMPGAPLGGGMPSGPLGAAPGGPLARPGFPGGPSPLGAPPGGPLGGPASGLGPRPVAASVSAGSAAPGGPPNSNYAPLPSMGGPAPSSVGGGSPNVVTAPAGLGPRPAGLGAPPSGLGAAPGGAPPNSNYGALPSLGGPAPAMGGGNPNVMTAPAGLGPRPVGLGAPSALGGAPNSNYGALPSMDNNPSPAMGGGAPNVMTAAPGGALGPRPVGLGAPHSALGGGPPSSNYGALPSMDSPAPAMGGGAPNVMTAPGGGLGSRPVGLGGPPSALGGGPGSNYGALPSMDSPAPSMGGGLGPRPLGMGSPSPLGAAPAAGGPPSSNYGSLPAAGPARPLGGPAPGPLGGPPSSNYGSLPPAGAPRPLGGPAPVGFGGPPSSFGGPAPGGPPSSNYGSLPPAGNPGFATGPPKLPAPAPVGPVTANYGSLPPAAGPGGPPRPGLGSTAPGMPGGMPGGMPAGIRPLGAGPGPSPLGGPPNSNYGSLPPAQPKFPPGGY